MIFSMIIVSLMVSSLYAQDTANQTPQVPVHNEDLIRLEMSKQRRAEQYEALVIQTNETLKSTTQQKPK